MLGYFRRFMQHKTHKFCVCMYAIYVRAIPLTIPKLYIAPTERRNDLAPT